GEAPATGRVTLTVGPDRAPLANAVVIVRDSVYRTSYQVVTDGDGVAEFPVPGIPAGSTSALTVSYPGSETLLGNATEVKVASRVQAPEAEGLPRLAWAGLVGLLLVGVVGVYAVRRYQRRQLVAARNIFEDAASRLLAGDEFKATIFLAYEELERHLIRNGFQARPADTPAEIGSAVTAAIPLGRDGVEGLIRIFERARYSPEQITAEDRRNAVASFRAAVDAIDKYTGPAPVPQGPRKVS
ncbi:MAG TPA: DUF4129 domain-containing protein, partial [Candidatus Thermoplasmatota archaeon]|nr:DUF4129 domain-containing protein [Candidatus Thermoplasmatota archaeon]